MPTRTHAALKTRQRALRDGFATPLALRVHRALSWLGRAEDAGDDADIRFVLLWIGFNAAYASDVAHAVAGGADGQANSERDHFREFFATLIGFDAQRRLYDLVWQRFPHEIRLLLDNRYVFAPFWHHHNGVAGHADWQDRLDRSRRAINGALARQETATILSILFDRLYDLQWRAPVAGGRPRLRSTIALRNQLVHGGATWNSDVNRAQVRDGAALLGTLLPVFIDLMMDHPGHDWPMPHYPVVD